MHRYPALHVRTVFPLWCPLFTESLFAPSGYYPSGDGVSRHLGRSYPSILAHTGSCASPFSLLYALWFSLGQRVFAGCCQSLLGEGLSRRYLCESFPACLDPYPGCSCGAFTRFFPQDFGLPCVMTRSALSNTPYSDFNTGSFFEAAVIPLCSGPQVCSPPRSPLPKFYFLSVGSSACSFSPRFRASASLGRTIDL